MADDTTIADTAAAETQRNTDAAAAQASAATDQATGFAKDAADRMREAGEQARTAFTDRIAGAGAALREGGQKVAENSQQIGLKMIDQAEQNAREAFNALRKAAQATDLPSVMQVQSEYLREQGSRAVANAREIGELIAQFGRDAIGAMRSGGDKPGS